MKRSPRREPKARASRKGKRRSAAKKSRTSNAPRPENKGVTAIVPVAPAPVVVRSVIPKVKEAVENLERVRRFVSMCLNVDLQNAERELARQNANRKAGEQPLVLSADERSRLETDWGTIPGVDKPFLMQPGAEKVLHWLQLRPKFITRETEIPGGHIEVVSHVVIYSKITGEEVFEGPDASCTTMETNYRYVWVESDLMPTDEEKNRLKMIGMGKMRKVAVWARGKKTGDRWAWYIRVDNPNIWNERNKVRQIGEKRGLVKGVKQMGALSAIFNADPSEWQFTTDEEESPENEMDYTEGGRQILVQGKPPSGRGVDHQAEAARKNQEELVRQKTQLSEDRPHGHQPGTERADQAAAQLKKVEEEDRKLKEQKSTDALKWKKDEERRREEESKPAIDLPKSVPPPATSPADASSKQPGGEPELSAEAISPDRFRVTGDTGDVSPMIEKYCKWGADQFYYTDLAGVQAMQALANQFKFKLTVSAAAGQKDAPATQTKPAGRGSRTPPPAPELVTGNIVKVTCGMTNKNAPTRQVKVGMIWYSCYRNTIFVPIDKGVGREIEMFIDPRSKNIVGLKRIGKTEFDPSDGATPIVPLDREPGTPTMFDK